MWIGAYFFGMTVKGEVPGLVQIWKWPSSDGFTRASPYPTEPSGVFQPRGSS
jgi:hypothetical protein